MSDTIRCPHCATEIEVTEALSAQLRSELRKQLEADQRAKEAALAQREGEIAQARTRLVQQEQQLVRAQAEVDERVATELAARLNGEQERITAAAETRARQQIALELQAKNQALQDQQQRLDEASQRLRESQAAELALRRQQRELEEARQQLELTITRRLDEERVKAVEAGQRAAAEQFQLKLADAEKRSNDLHRQLEASQAAELALRRQQRELEEAQQQLDLTIARRMDEERAQATEAGQRAAAEQFQLKIAEAEKRSNDLLKQLEDAQRKAAQGSQQLQGEILELSLETSLRQQFPRDEITPVPKGVHGGDIVQSVRDAGGHHCGDILWESKRTKNWSDGWLPKLRDDQRAAKAQLAVLATMELPKGCTTFQLIDGVWVTSMPCALSIATALRAWMIEVAAVKRLQDGRHDTSDQLYGYVTGPQFRHQFEGVMESFFTMREELEQEKRALQRVWSKRDKQIGRGIEQAAQMYGNLEGILGGALPAPPQLELPGLPCPQADGNGDGSAAEEEAFALTSRQRVPKPDRTRKLPPATSTERE